MQINQFTVSYREDQLNRQVIISPNLTIIDVDSSFLSRAEISFVTTPPENSSEILSFLGQIPSDIFIVVQNAHNLVFSGTASISAYQALMRNVFYEHSITSGDPTSGIRTFEILVRDDMNLTSQPDYVALTFMSTNDAPIVDLNGLLPGRDSRIQFRESSGTISIVLPIVSILDVDNNQLFELNITLNNPQNESEYISLSFNNISFSIIQNENYIRISSASGSDILCFRDLLLSLTYSNSESEPSNITREVIITVSDGLLISDPARIFIDIELVNDPPSLDLDLSSNGSDFQTIFIENGFPVLISSQASIIDPDSVFISELRIQVGRFSDFFYLSINSILTCLNQSLICSINFTPSISISSASSIINNITFFDSANEPDNISRIYYLSVFDGLAWSVASKAVVRIQPTNDNVPTFLNAPYYSIIEENLLDLIFLQAKARDYDDQNSIISLTFAIVECILNCPFLINSASGVVSTSPSIVIDRETRDFYHIQLVVSDGLLNSTTSLFINITDQNDNCPTFFPNVYHYTIPIQSPIGTSLLKVSAFDQDLHPFGSNSIRYIILFVEPQIPNSTFFAIDPVSGVLFITVDENFLPFSITSYVVIVGAFGPNCSLSVAKNASILISIVQNIMAPNFLTENLTCFFSESQSTSNCIVAASDEDIGIYGSFTFSLIDPSNTFSISLTSGIVFVRNLINLDFEVTQSYILTVLAIDNGRPPLTSSTTLRINITDVNDNIPIFTLSAYTANICENAPIGYTILKIEASDSDSGTFGVIIYSITPTYLPFSIGNTTGNIYLLRLIDYEATSNYMFNVTASDGGGNRAVTSVKIYVLNDNDIAPLFTQLYYQVYIPENATQGTRLSLPLQLATDQDSCTIDQCNADGTFKTELLQSCKSSSSPNNETILFYSIQQSPDSLFFTINNRTGSISLTQNLNFEILSFHTITIEVSDSDFISFASVMIFVNDSNDNPPLFTNMTYNAELLEGITIGTLVLQVTAQDIDAALNARIMYSIAPSITSFTIDNNGNIYTNAAIDYERTNSISITVTAFDMGFPQMFGIADVLITVIDLNDNTPMFSQNIYTFSILENIKLGEIFGKVQAFDLDSGVNAKLTYYLQINSTFAINTTTGDLFLVGSVDFERNSFYNFTVVALDQGVPPLKGFARIIIRVRDVNDNAIMFNQNVFHVRLFENQPPNVLLSFVTSDLDSPQISNFFFSLTNDSLAIPFSVSVDGNLSNTQNIDYEINSSFIFDVIVYDNGPFDGFSDTANVIISVLDLNDNPPVFPNIHIILSIEEHPPLQTNITQVAAVDRDTGINSAVAYAITDAHPPSLIKAFDIDTVSGILIVANSTLLDREELASISLIVTAYNPNFPTQQPGNASVNISITLSDINDNAPTFVNTPYVFSIPEDFTPIFISENDSVNKQRFVGQVIASDLDIETNALITYSIADSSYPFVINSSTGEILTNSTLDREKFDSYSVYIIATDSGIPSLMNITEVIIEITDLNDNSPLLIDMISLSINESTPIGTFIYIFNPLDPDIGNNSLFSFSIRTNISNFPFVMNNLGNIVISQKLDRELIDFYSFEVIVADQGSVSFSASSFVQVEILDANDNAPIVRLNNSRSIYIPETASIGTFVTAVHVTDDDISPNNIYRLFIIGDNSLFTITFDGIVTIRLPIDFEIATSHNVSIAAQNVEPPYFIGETTIHVFVVNENDEVPTINFLENQTVFNFFEGHFSLAINPLFNIDDRDQPPFNEIVSANVSLGMFDPSFSVQFIPNNNRLPYPCLSENKLLKVQGCGTENIALITRDDNSLVLFEGATLTGFTLSLTSSQNQYAEYRDGIGLLTEEDGITIAFWLLYQSSVENVSSSIFSKVAPDSPAIFTKTLLELTCISNGYLQFSYNSVNGIRKLMLNQSCTNLKGAWHHLAVVISQSSDVWYLHLYIDGNLKQLVVIDDVRDEAGRIFVGTVPIPSDFNQLHQFFNGSLHFFYFGNQVSSSTIYCSIGCGEALRVSELSSSITPYFSYETGVLTLSGSSSELEYEQVLNSLFYINAEDEPRSLQQHLIYNVFDGIANSLPIQIIIHIIALNDYTPVLNLGAFDGNFHTSFSEGGNPIPVVSSNNFSLIDRDRVSFTYIVNVTILNQLQPHPEEVIRVSEIIGNILTSYNDASLIIKGDAPITDISLVLSTITYQNLGDEFNGTFRNVSFVVNDNSERFSEIRYTTVYLIPVNDLPQISIAITQLIYSEGDSARTLTPQLIIRDNDNVTLVWARIEIHNRLDGINEILIVPPTSASGIVSDFDRNDGVLLLSGVALLQTYASLISKVKYQHLSEGISTSGTREVEFTVNDGKNTSNPVSVYIIFNELNNPPFIDLDVLLPGTSFSTIFTEDLDTTITVLTTDFTITDLDSFTLSWAEVILHPLLDPFESLVVSTLNSNLTVNFNDSTGRLYLQPDVSLQSPITDFISTLLTLTYTNPSEEPTPVLRTLSFLVNDGISTSNLANLIIDIIPVNDIPFIDLDVTSPSRDYITSYTEGDPPIYITSRNVSVVDNDDVSFVSLTLTITSNLTLSPMEEIITSTTNITIPIPVSINDTLHYSISTLSNINTLLESLQYSNRFQEPRGNFRKIGFSVFDGENFSSIVFTTINIFYTNNETPNFVMPDYLFRVPENMPPPFFIGSVMAVDLDFGIDGKVFYALSTSQQLFLDNFFIVSGTGSIFSNTSFDREILDLYSLQVFAFDSGRPQRSSFVNISIVVDDLNEFPPMILNNTNVIFNVFEEQTPPIIIGALPSNDMDAGSNAEIRFEIIAGDGLDLFAITSNSGIIYTNFTFDREERDNYQLVIRIFDQGSPSLSSMIVITVIILDINDNSPIFRPSIMTIEFPENIPNALVLKLNATDRDSSPNSMFFYQIFGSDLFTIRNETGEIFTRSDGLDRETEAVHNLVGTAEDFGGFNGTQTLRGFVTIMIIVQDVNDNPPSFDQASYSSFVSENSPVNATVILIHAEDEDLDINGSVRYMIISPDVPFVIDPILGLVTVSGKIDYEETNKYIIEVLAFDLGNYSLNSTVSLTIFINDTNDNSPIFSDTITLAFLSENFINENIAIVSATDRDSTSNSEIVYELLNFKKVFFIDPKSGVLKNLVQIDYETACIYNLTVYAIDRGFPSLSSFASIIVTILDIEDVAPKFTTPIFSISALENDPLKSLLNLTATDNDGICPNKSRESLPLLIFSLVTKVQPFTLSLSGELKAANLDREFMDFYLLNVSVSDSAGLSDNAIIRITVDDVNDNSPSFPDSINIFYFNISESTPIETVIGRIPASDADLVDQGNLLFTLLFSSSTQFTINSTGYLILIDTLDFESSNTISSVIQVRDTSNNSIFGIVIVSLIDADDNPPEILGILEMVNFTEGMNSLSILPNLILRDEDINFQLFSSAHIMLSSPEPYDFLPDSCDCDNLPCVPSCLEYLSINATVSHQLSIVHKLGSRSITISGIDSIKNYQNILRNTIYINKITNPDPFRRTILVRITDFIGLHTQSSILINLIVLNQSPPLLDLDGFDTPSRNFETIFTENSDSIYIVNNQISFIDFDIGTNLISRLQVNLTNPFDSQQEFISLSPNIYPSFLNLSLSNTSLTIIGAGSHSDYISVLLGIRYTNNALEPNLEARIITFEFEEGHLVGESVVTLVLINGINDFPPEISPRQFITKYFEESSPISIISPDVVIFDRDSIDSNRIELIIEMISGYDFGGDLIYLQPEAITPEIQINISSEVKITFSGNASLDSFTNILQNIRYSYRFLEFVNIFRRLVRISISDDPQTIGYFTATTELCLIPINDNQPTLLPIYNVSRFEDSQILDVILQISVDDPDNHSPPRFNFSLQDNMNNTFSIDNNGILFLSSTLDFEKINFYNLLILVNDSNIQVSDVPQSSSTVLFYVLDINDNRPIFNPNIYNVTVNENLLVGSLVLTLQAFDLDSDLHGILEFNFLNDDTDFFLNSTTGEITILNPLDFTRQEVYIITAHVSNPNVSNPDFASITIIVLMVNNNPPFLSISPPSSPFLDGQNRLSFDFLILNITDIDPNPTIDSANISISSTVTIFDYLSIHLPIIELTISGNMTKTIQISGLAPLSTYVHIISLIVYNDDTNEPLNSNRSIHFVVEDSTNFFVSNIVNVIIFPMYINDNPPRVNLSSNILQFQTTFIGKFPRIHILSLNKVIFTQYLYTCKPWVYLGFYNPALF